MKNSNKPKVLLAMSGGVDSSVAAFLLKKQGFDIVAAFMKNWSDTKDDLGECTWRNDRKSALAIASMLEIPLITLDFEKQYRKQIVEEMYKLYKKGLVPNPDVDCNQKIKFPLLWKAAQKIGAKFIVTGHYARIKQIKTNKSSKNANVNNNYQYKLLRAKDETKDQSYFLYRLTQKDLSHTIFPIGEYTKKQVREIAEKNNLPNFNRKSTTGICFIGKVNLKKFLQKKIKPKSGKILDPQGNIIGTHDGIYYYTVGQRIGPRFGIEIEKKVGKKESMKKWYVAKKILKTNTIIAAPENHPLNFKKEIIIKNCHWINEIPSKNKISNIKVRIRQVGELLPAKLSFKKGKYHLTLSKPIIGIAEGQAAVIYVGTEVLGGGVISFSSL